MTLLHDLLEIDFIADPLFDENCYVLRRRDADRCLLVDPGLQAEAVLRLVGERNLRVDRILVSHGHPDHVAGIPAVKAEHRCPAAIHPADRPLLETVATFPGVPPDLPPPACEEDLADAQVVEWQELQIAVLHTPGHTRGSVSFLVGPDLLTGDTLFQRGIGRSDLPGGSFDTLLFSIRSRLYTLDPDTTVHPGHGPATTIGAEMRLNPFVRGPEFQ
jgi:hydroxyacylglutathione hydrolase